nr:hypothetical protein [Ramlibacter montanisoli]
MADKIQVGGIHHLVHVLRAGADAEEARRLLEQRLQPFLFGALVALRQHGRRGFRAGAIEACRAAGLVDHRRIGEGEPGVLFLALALHAQRQVLHEEGLARQRPLHEGHDVREDVVPDLAERRAQARRMLAAQDLRVAVVVEHLQLRAPGNEHGEAGAQHQVHHRTQRLRPLLWGPHVGARPVVRAHQPGHGRVAREERGWQLFLHAPECMQQPGAARQEITP